jgi:hypothetical protein
MAIESYVYDNSEVKKTGRTSSKKLGSGKMDVLFEITPTDPMIGSWKKWVRDRDLYEIDKEAK